MRRIEMNQRIRYIKSNGGYTSMRVLKARDGVEYRPVLSEDMLTGKIVAVNGTVLSTVKGTSHHKTKIAVKRALESLGVEFAPEGRRRKKPEDNET